MKEQKDINQMWEDRISKTKSKLTKEINRASSFCKSFQKSNEDKKEAIRKYDSFIKKLLSENRITKEELAKFITKKEV